MASEFEIRSEGGETPGETLIGLLLQVFVSDVLIVLGLGIQKMALMRSEDHNSLLKLVTNCRWLSGLIVFAIGQLCELTALSFTSQVNITALSTLKLVWNALIAKKLFGEPFALWPVHSGIRVLLGWDLGIYLMMVSGAIVVVFCSPPQPKDDEYDADTLSKMWVEIPFVVFGVFLWTAMLVSIVAVIIFVRSCNKAIYVAFVIGNLAAMTSAMSLTLAKISTTLLQKLLEGDNQYREAKVSSSVLTVTYVMCIVSVLLLLNIGLKRFDQALFYPICKSSGLSTRIAEETLTDPPDEIFRVGTQMKYWAVFTRLQWGFSTSGRTRR